MINDEKFRYEIVKLIAYMITSAKGLVTEPKLYGPLRLIDSASRLIKILDERNLATEELKELKEKIDKRKIVLMSSKEEFLKLLDELVADVAKILGKL